jgi:hypothetical protein
MYDFVNVMNVCDRMSERMHVACISNDLSLCELVRMYECVYTADVTHFIATPGCLHDITRHAIATHWACRMNFTNSHSIGDLRCLPSPQHLARYENSHSIGVV